MMIVRHVSGQASVRLVPAYYLEEIRSKSLLDKDAHHFVVQLSRPSTWRSKVKRSDLDVYVPNPILCNKLSFAQPLEYLTSGTFDLPIIILSTFYEAIGSFSFSFRLSVTDNVSQVLSEYFTGQFLDLRYASKQAGEMVPLACPHWDKT